MLLEIKKRTLVWSSNLTLVWIKNEPRFSRPYSVYFPGSKTRSIGISALVFSLGLLAVGCAEALSQLRLQAGEEVLVVNSDLADPAVPLDLSLRVQLLRKDRLLAITVRVGKHPAFPAALFFNRNVKVEIKLPIGLQLREGSLTWEGDLQGEEIKQLQIKVDAVKDVDGIVFASAIGHGPGGRVDADTEQFYVLVKGDTMRISIEPFVSSDPLKPGRAVPAR